MSNNSHISQRLGNLVARLSRLILLAWIVALALSVAVWPLVARADIIRVDGTSCTLPAANRNSVFRGCPAGSGPTDTLVISGIIPLATGRYRADGLNATPDITSTIIISATGGSATVERSGNAPYRLFHIARGGHLILRQITVANGKVAAENGGAIYNRGDLTLIDSRLVANTANSGGAIYDAPGSRAVITQSLLISNSAKIGGGALMNLQAEAVIDGSQIISNAANSGGAIANTSYGLVTITKSGILSNTANAGGALYNDTGGVIALQSVQLRANNAHFDGGAILSRASSTLTVIDSSLVANRAERGSGGAILSIVTSTVALTNSQILGNHAGLNGGGLFNGGVATLANDQILSNVASAHGGALYNDGILTITASIFTGNYGNPFGSVLYAQSSQTLIRQSCIVNNSDTAVEVQNDPPLVATGNWWGAANGPSGAGHGAGDSVSAHVRFSPFLHAPILGCPLRSPPH